MRRLGRILFTLCSVVSLLLCVAVSVLWVRSGETTDIVYRILPPTKHGLDRWWAVTSSRGGILEFAYSNAETVVIMSPGWKYDRRPWATLAGEPYEIDPTRGDSGVDWGGGGFRITRLSSTRNPRLPPDEILRLAAPHWACALLFAVLPAQIVAKLWLARRKRVLGLCPSCG